jgi:hypothetical protein
MFNYEKKMENNEKKPISINLEDARARLASFGTQIQEYLGKADAKIETYKFSVEKTDAGIVVDATFKATLKGNGGDGSSGYRL